LLDASLDGHLNLTYHHVMTMFISKVWGFDNPCGPLIFSTPGWRENAVQKLRPGDRVILVGTMGEETPPPDKNRVLGMMEPSTTRVATSDFPLPNPDDKRLWKEDGTFRWPYGLLNYRAWEFAPGLFLSAVAPRGGNPFGSAAASGIVSLTAEEEARVLAHPFHQIPLLTSFSADQKLYGEQEAKRRGAPVPTPGVRASVMHMRNAHADVYWFRLSVNGKVAGHKIGWAFDWRQRLRQFNAVSLHTLGGLHYKVYKTQLLGTARQAFYIEQELFRIFDANRHPGNREVLTGISTEKIELAWHAQMTAALLGRKANSG
jgi:hypothetical protein